jgi:hypothetical protein
MPKARQSLLSEKPSERRNWAIAIVLLAVALGCSQREEIARYKVDKPPPLEPVASNPHAGSPQTGEAPKGAPTDRTLGAIVPLVPQGWFFKLTGPTERVAARVEEFTTFLKSVTFSDGKPAWKLPEGWQERPGNQIRYATLILPGDPPLEVSVTALPNSGTEDENYVLANVNRWRGQLRLVPIDREQLASDSTQIQLAGATATLVNLEGHATESMGRPPFFSGARDGN